MGKLGREELRKYYNQSQCYLQFSSFEGFGCALCEAMLCGCVPVVSSVNILPEIIDDTGFVLERKDPAMAEALLKEVLMQEDLQERGHAARERIKQNYPLHKREEALLALMEA